MPKIKCYQALLNSRVPVFLSFSNRGSVKNMLTELGSPREPDPWILFIPDAWKLSVFGLINRSVSGFCELVASGPSERSACKSLCKLSVKIFLNDNNHASMNDLIDLRSDTVTRPTPGMFEAMMHARVGDDVFREDPEINELEEMAAGMFGKDAALFCPSGTMTNQIAIKLHTQPGDEVVCHRLSHVYNFEGGGMAFHSGASVRTLEGDRGRFTAAGVEDNINDPDDVHKPITRLVVVENTSNKGGGALWTWQEMEKIQY